MAFVEKNIVRQAVSSTLETVFTLAANKVAIKDIHICNNSNTDCHISVWLVPNSASPTNENVMFHEWNIPANDFAHYSGFQMLDVVGDTIRARAETNDQITLTISGAEIS